MKRLYLFLLLIFFTILNVSAQRKTDRLDRGVVAVPSGSGVLVSWRILANEYYGVKYNLYRNGTKIVSDLNVSNYLDTSGNTSSKYKVASVINGQEQITSMSAEAGVWSSLDGSTTNSISNPYLRIPMQDVFDRKGNRVFCSCGSHTPDASVAQNYILNDASVADLDGDGEMEIIIKRINGSDANAADPYAFKDNGNKTVIYSRKNDRAYVLFEAYKLNGERLWWIDCGPNMVSLNSTEINIIAYDWDGDNKAEVILRGADNMIVHPKEGQSYTIGSATVNSRPENGFTDAQYAWTHTGNEYLLYLNGEKGTLYKQITYPLPRFESDEINLTEQQVWSPNNSNGGYGHRSSKYFFGAPVLDGRKASIFLARGIYTQTKMCALDVNPSTHELTTRWTWRCKDQNSKWFGQGNHNMSIADVDGDGCDEIIYGSMVIDNNGRGLSTTGLGHGDALHVGDLDPFRKGLEVFACNEDQPSNNFRNATTSEIYLREPAHWDAENNKWIDDGRCMAGNFTNDYPGSIGASTQSGIAALSMVQTVPTNPTYIDVWTNNWTTNTPNPALNWRIYWDGDLLEESMNGPGSGEGELFVAKNGNRLMMTNGAKCNNDTKKNPCFTGDIIGDWREEIIMRSNDNKELRVYTTTIPTTNRIPCLWYDPEYRQAMVWQMCAYNQPPHVSFFMGEMEGLTKVPVPNTMEERVEFSSFQSSDNGKDAIAYNIGSISVPSGFAPRTFVIDVPSNVSGNDDNNNITRSYQTSTLSNNLIGDMNLVKQGDGLLIINGGEHTYAGNTDVFAGSVAFNGTLTNSPVWMNRHTTLYTAGTINSSVTMEYGSTLYVGNTSKDDGSAPVTNYGTANVDTLNLHEGSRLVFDIDKANKLSDVLNMQVLTIRKRDWQYGPKYLAPVLQVNSTATLEKGNYKIGKIDKVEGIDDIIIEGNFAAGTKQRLSNVSGNLYIKVYDENDDPIVYPEASISMTHVNYDEPDKSYGELTTAISGYNKISNGNVGFANTDWKYNWITYLKVDLSDFKRHDVTGVTLSFNASGAIDGTRSTSWGIGYNNSEWQPTMTYNTADRSIINIGNTLLSSGDDVKEETQFKNLSWDITEVYDNDEVGILTILVYETAAGSGYVTNPKVDVQYNYVEVEEEPTNVVSGGTDVLFQYDFEDQSKIDGYWTTSTSGRYASSWVIRGVDTHYGKYNAGDTNGATLTFSAIKDLGSDYTSLESYKLEFDFAVEPINTASNSGDQTQIFEIYDSKNNVLCDWRLTSPKGAAGNRVGSFYLKGIETSHFNANTTPYFYHVTITGDGEGTNMEVVGADGEKSVYKLSDELVYIGNLKYNTAKSYGGLCLDDITLVHNSPSILTITRDKLDYQSGIYDMVNVERTFNAGYSSLCLPFNMFVVDFTSNDSEAYVAYFNNVEVEDDGTTTLLFKNSDKNKIEANKPCIIYLSKALENPSFTNLPVFEENAMTIVKNYGWSMTGNYQAGMSMYGKYGVAQNSDIRHGGKDSTINGLTAYLEHKGSGASAKIRIVDSNGATIVENVKLEDEVTVTAIYTINGTKVTSLQPGINILKMSDGSVRKVMRK